MNCKPGDLARIVHQHLYGRMVEVLRREPLKRYALPDGWRAAAGDPATPAWVVKLLGPPVRAALRGGETRETRYGAVPDCWLRPIRDPGDDAKDEMLRPLPAEPAPAKSLETS
jgi:hypothetical protein